MINRDYTKEIGVIPTGKTVSWTYVVLILAVLLVAVGWFAVVEMKAYNQAHKAKPADSSETSMMPARPGLPVATAAMTAKTGLARPGHAVS